MNEAEYLRVLSRVREILARAEQTTPGPWGSNIVDGRSGERISIYQRQDATSTDRLSSKAQAEADATFVAQAREDVPWLCQTILSLLADAGTKDSDQELQEKLDRNQRLEKHLEEALIAVRDVMQDDLLPLVHAHGLRVSDQDAARIRSTFRKVSRALRMSDSKRG